jgi:hypothetical protein
MFRPSLGEGISGRRLLQAEVDRVAMILFVYDFPNGREIAAIPSCKGGQVGEGKVAAFEVEDSGR